MADGENQAFFCVFVKLKSDDLSTKTSPLVLPTHEAEGKNPPNIRDYLPRAV